MCINFVDTIGSLIGKTSGIYILLGKILFSLHDNLTFKFNAYYLSFPSDVCVVPLCTALCALGNKSAGVVVCWQSELIQKLREFTSQPRITPETAKAIVRTSLISIMNLNYQLDIFLSLNVICPY